VTRQNRTQIKRKKRKRVGRKRKRVGSHCFAGCHAFGHVCRRQAHFPPALALSPPLGQKHVREPPKTAPPAPSPARQITIGNHRRPISTRHAPWHPHTAARRTCFWPARDERLRGFSAPFPQLQVRAKSMAPGWAAMIVPRV